MNAEIYAPPLSCLKHVWWWLVGDLVAKLCLTLAAPWTVARQAFLSMGFSRQEYWNGLLCCPPGDLPDPGIEPASLVSCTGRQVFTTSVTWEALSISIDLTILDFQYKVNHIRTS